MLCECGCGELAPISDRTERKRGYVKGEPRRFKRGHRIGNIENYLADPKTGCWNWQGVINNWGYGIVRLHGHAWAAHRLHYTRAKGEIPDGLQVDHLCGNKRCCNPDHLEAVTPRENYRRGPGTRLSMDTAREMREKHAAGQSTFSLAREYRLSTSHAWAICRGKLWAE